MPKLDIYSGNALGPLPAGNSSLCVNTPSSSGNVYFANGQTDRILVPYRPLTKGRITEPFLSEGVVDTFLIKMFSSIDIGLKVRHATKNKKL
jgi:hypothetical protein